MVEQINDVLNSSHNHTQFITKLQTSHHWESHEVSLNWSPTTKDITEEAISRLVGRAKTWKELVPDLHMSITNLDIYHGCRGAAQRSEGSQQHTRIPIPRFQCGKEKSPSLLIVRTSGDCGRMRRGQLQSQAILLKGQCMDLLTDGLTCSEL